MLEFNLENKVVEWAKGEGGRAIKLKDDARGFPDRTILLPGARIAFPELKRPSRNKKYEQQKRWIEFLVSLGFRADFCHTLDEVKQLFYDNRRM